MVAALFVRLLCMVWLLALLRVPLLAQALPALEAAVQALEQDAAMRPANWGMTVMDARTGQVLLAHNAYRNQATASVMKVVTTAAALGVLGADFRFATTLAYSGTLSDGVLQGDLYIRGTGDPSLGSARFGTTYDLSALMAAWVQGVKAAGIREVRGRVIGDDRFFSTQLTPGTWNWEDMGNYYGAGASGLNFLENLYRLDLKPGPQAGSATEVLRTDPAIADLQFVNELTTGKPGSGDNAYIYGAPYTGLRYLRGSIPAGSAVFSIKGSIPDPALLAAQRLHEELGQCGVPVQAGATSTRRLKQAGMPVAAALRDIHTWQSPPLRDLVRETNLESLNLYAEALARRVAVARGKTAPDAAAAAQVLDEYWRSQGIDTRGMCLCDGSGLSPGNMLSTHQLAAILVKARQTGYYEALYASLPVAGRSGSLSSMLKGTAAEGNLRAKSGYIQGVRSYAGYVQTRSGKELTFAVIANGYSGTPGEMRRRLETLMQRLAEE
ncbi:MAG: D-alanyl-D-alanine carboxypeptidase/D-alanyl-D-alanine-endopeptidase [Bacteroidia bacterium]